jgi:hypothetical protein
MVLFFILSGALTFFLGDFLGANRADLNAFFQLYDEVAALLNFDFLIVQLTIDLAYLANNGLPYHGLLSRVEGDTRPDADMKVCLLNRYLFNLGYGSIREANCIMFDDNLKVLEAMAAQGVIVINATKENARQVA